MNEPLSELIRIRGNPSHAARLGEASALAGRSQYRKTLVIWDVLRVNITTTRAPANAHRKACRNYSVGFSFLS